MNVCRTESGKAAVAAKIHSVVGAYTDGEEESLADGVFTYRVGFSGGSVDHPESSLKPICESLIDSEEVGSKARLFLLAVGSKRVKIITGSVELAFKQDHVSLAIEQRSSAKAFELLARLLQLRFLHVAY